MMPYPMWNPATGQQVQPLPPHAWSAHYHALGGPQTVQKVVPSRCLEFWDNDWGDIILRVEATYYKINSASYLMPHCTRFQDLLYLLVGETCQGQQVYHLPWTRADDFKLFLYAQIAESPLGAEGVQQRSGTLLTIESIVAALLRVADHLGCARVREAVVQELCTRHYPDQEPPRAPPGSPPPSPSLSLWTRLRTYNDVLSMIAVARAHGIPRVLKRAFYDLIADDGFWLELEHVHGASARRSHQVSMSRLQLSDQDVIALYRARDVLTRKWRTLALQPPGCTVMPRTGGQVLSRCVSQGGGRRGGTAGKQKRMCRGKAAARESARRIDSWRAQMVTELEPECGTANVFAHLGLLLDDRDGGRGGRKRKQLEETWCWSCLEERKAAWRRARQEWWELLDDLIGVAIV